MTNPTLTGELREFVKVFPPPYSYDAFPESIYDTKGNELVSIAHWMDVCKVPQKQRDALGNLICELLNNHLTNATITENKD